MGGEERWAPIAEAPGYDVSSWGRVRRGQDGVATWPNHKGYLMVPLMVAGRELPRLFYVHRLVAIAFRGVDVQRPLVNHRDGIKDHNALENLRWSTPAGNVIHGRRLRLERCGQGVLFDR